MCKAAASPEALGISSAGILSFLDALDASGLEIHGLVMLRHGQVAADMAWRPYGNDILHLMFSLSKSFTSSAIGFAIQEGKLRLTDRVAELLPDKLPPNPSDGLLAISVEHLLTMTSGLDPASDAVGDDPDWAKRTLSHPVIHTPGTVFHYNSQGSHLLSEIVQRVTGEKTRDYLVPRLFVKIGIAPPEWDETPLGVTCGGWGLRISTYDVAKFGQLLLQDGCWEGEQVLPAGWVALATAKHADNSKTGATPDWQVGYGFQFWRCVGGYFRGDGAYGQICWVMPKEGVVIAITAGLRDMGKEAALLHDHLIPAVDAPPADAQTQAQLQARIAQLSYPFPADDGSGSAGVAEEYADDEGNVLGVHFHGDTLALHIMIPDINEMISAKFAKAPDVKPDMQSLPMTGPMQSLASYGWEKDAIHTTLRMICAPFTRKSTLTFTGDTVTEKVDGIGFESSEKTYRKIHHAE